MWHSTGTDGGLHKMWEMSWLGKRSSDFPEYLHCLTKKINYYNKTDKYKIYKHAEFFNIKLDGAHINHYEFNCLKLTINNYIEGACSYRVVNTALLVCKTKICQCCTGR